jgi:hypothetical protein
MRLAYSTKLKEDVTKSVSTAVSTRGFVNLPAIAEEIRKRNEIENIALEDIERMVLEKALALGAVVEFDSCLTTAAHVLN